MPGLAIDIGGSKIAVSASAGGRVLFEHAVTLNAGLPPGEVLAPLLAYLREKAALCGGFRAIALASAPNLDADGRVTRWPNHPHWNGTPLVTLFVPLARDEITWCDDGTAATIADAHVLATDGLIHLSLGTGVGGGILFEDRIVRDRELGHLLVHLDGLPCCCGRNGCLQAYASGRSLAQHLDSGAGGEAEWFAQAVRMLAVTIANLVELFRSPVVTLSGGLSRRFPALCEAITVQLRDHYLKPPLPMPTIMYSPHGSNASLQGALILTAAVAPHRTACQVLRLC